MPNKTEEAVIQALTTVRQLLPFPFLGLDTDNGSEFINHDLADWCLQRSVMFTRSREYKKNDQAHVKEKNGSIVRRLVGYDRFEGTYSYRALASLYAISRLYINFFQPSLKLAKKSRDGGRVRKVYDKAQTPYERVLRSEHILDSCKTRLRQQFESLDPVLLLSKIEKRQNELWQTAVAHIHSPISPIPQTLSDSIVLPKLTRQRPPRRNNRSPVIEDPVPKRWRKTLEHLRSDVYRELDKNPYLSTDALLDILFKGFSAKYKQAQLKTVEIYMNRWRVAHLAVLSNSKPYPEPLQISTAAKNFELGCSKTPEVCTKYDARLIEF